MNNEKKPINLRGVQTEKRRIKMFNFARFTLVVTALCIMSGCAPVARPTAKVTGFTPYSQATDDTKSSYFIRNKKEILYKDHTGQIRTIVSVGDKIDKVFQSRHFSFVRKSYGGWGGEQMFYYFENERLGKVCFVEDLRVETVTVSNKLYFKDDIGQWYSIPAAAEQKIVPTSTTHKIVRIFLAKTENR